MTRQAPSSLWDWICYSLCQEWASPFPLCTVAKLWVQILPLRLVAYDLDKLLNISVPHYPYVQNRIYFIQLFGKIKWFYIYTKCLEYCLTYSKPLICVSIIFITTAVFNQFSIKLSHTLDKISSLCFHCILLITALTILSRLCCHNLLSCLFWQGRVLKNQYLKTWTSHLLIHNFVL